MTRPRTTSRRHAFTLVELIAAVVVLSVAIPPVLWTIREAQLTRADAILAVDARWIASERLEEVLADRYSTTRGWDHIVDGNYPDESSVTGYPMFARTVTITETGADLSSAGDGFKTVEVTVSWTTTRGKSHDLAIATVVTEGA